MALTRTQTTEAKTKLGRYELLRELTTSGVGTSWLARPIGETFEVTLLKIHRHMAKSATSVEALLAAAQSARKFSHDNVAAVLDAGVVESEPFVVLEYVGESLSSLLRSAGPAGLPIPIAMRVSLDILEGLAAAHTNDPPIGHGELGPWCVYVGSDGVARIGGFGVDQAVWRFGAHYVKNMERLSYGAPERVRAMSSTLGQELGVADEQSDLFSAAVLIFELLTRQKLFASKMEAAVVQKVLSTPIPTAQSFRPEIPLEVSDALKNALVRDRSERLDTLEDFIVALEGAGPELIASNEAVAELVATYVAQKSASGEIVSSALTPGAATKPAPVPGRATLMFDEAKDLFPPKPVVAPVVAPTPSPAAAAVAAPAVAAPAVAAPAVGAAAAEPKDAPKLGVRPNGAPIRPRARTLMGFGALKPGASPPAPDVADVAPAPGGAPTAASRSSSIELDEGDIDVEVGDPMALPTKVVDLPISGATPAAPAVAAKAAAAKPEAAGAPAAPVKAGAPPKRPPARRAATLMGIQAPEDILKMTKGAAPDFSDDPTTNLDDKQIIGTLTDEATTVDDASKKAAAADAALEASATAALAATAAAGPAVAPRSAAASAAASPPPGSAAALGPSDASAKVEAMRAAREEGTPHSPVSGQRPAGQRALSAEMLRTGAILAVSNTSYELIAPVARGGMATVWAAREVGSHGLDKMVGIKTMLPELSDDADFESMFLDEARVAAKIRHENVATIVDLGQESNLLYLVMEWVDGETVGTLQRASRASGGVPTAIIVRIAADICAGLHVAHELCDDAGHHLEVVHRDISPANVLVNRAGITKIVDFGIAKSKGRLHVTKVGAMVKGKTPYLSPEQIGGLAIDRRSDLFSLGALLYVMATGLHPFRGETELSTIENIAIKAPVPLKSIVPDVDPGFEQIVLRLLEKDPKKRFQTAREVKDALDALDAKMTVHASHADVAAFVEKVIGDKLDQRRDMLVAGLGKIERQERSTESPPSYANTYASPHASGDANSSSNGATPASALEQVLEKMRQSNPDALDMFSLGAAAKAAPLPEIIGAPASSGVASSGVAGLSSDGEPSAAALQGPSSEPLSGPSSSGDGEAALPVFSDEDPIETPAAPANTKRLVMLVVVGLLIGLAIIAALEIFRGDSHPTGSASAQPSAPPPAKASSGPAPVVTAPPTATPSTEPTASPSTSATSEPTPPATTEPTTPPVTPPTTAPVTPPGPGFKPPPGPLPHPPTGPVKPKPPKKNYNPVTI